MKSTRSIAVMIVVLTLSVALFTGKVDADRYLTVGGVIVAAYFAKRDDK